jgi:hypothetical protein
MGDTTISRIHQVFVSHGSHDPGDDVAFLLRAAGWKVLSSREPTIGGAPPNDSLQALRAADCVVAVGTTAAVIFETGLAVGLGKPVIVVESAPGPLPAPLRTFKTLRRSDVELSLVPSLEVMVGQLPRTSTESDPGIQSSGTRPSTALLARRRSTTWHASFVTRMWSSWRVRLKAAQATPDRIS